MKAMYEFIITATSTEVRLISEVHDLDLAIKVFHEHAESGLFDRVELMDSRTGEVHAHTNGENEDYYLSEALTTYMVLGMVDMVLGEMSAPLPSSEEPPQTDPLEAMLRAIVEQGGLPS